MAGEDLLSNGGGGAAAPSDGWVPPDQLIGGATLSPGYSDPPPTNWTPPDQVISLAIPSSVSPAPPVEPPFPNFQPGFRGGAAEWNAALSDFLHTSFAPAGAAPLPGTPEETQAGLDVSRPGVTVRVPIDQTEYIRRVVQSLQTRETPPSGSEMYGGPLESLAVPASRSVPAHDVMLRKVGDTYQTPGQQANEAATAEGMRRAGELFSAPWEATLGTVGIAAQKVRETIDPNIKYKASQTFDDEMARIARSRGVSPNDPSLASERLRVAREIYNAATEVGSGESFDAALARSRVGVAGGAGFKGVAEFANPLYFIGPGEIGAVGKAGLRAGRAAAATEFAVSEAGMALPDLALAATVRRLGADARGQIERVRQALGDNAATIAHHPDVKTLVKNAIVAEGETPTAQNITQVVKQVLDEGATPTKIGDVSRVTPETGAAPESIAPASSGPTTTAYTPRGMAVETRFDVVNAPDLVSSHDTSLAVNPKFPAELQPRDRARAASEDQITGITSGLQPERLGESRSVGEGAPIIGEGNVVESGNARTIALQRLYKQEHATGESYRQWLVDNASRFGLDPAAVEAMPNPVLVRRRTGTMTPDQRAEFVRQANEPAVASMSVTERASTDAGRVSTDLLGQLSPEAEISSATNRDFVRQFMDQVISPTERGGLVDASGALSQEGVARIRNAIFQKAYGDSAALEKLAEATDSNVRNIANGMLSAAPKIAQIREGIASGALFGGLDVSSDIAAAMRKLSALRDEGTPISVFLQQQPMFGRELSPVAEDILAFMSENGRSSKKIGDFLNRYADEVLAAGNPSQGGLFGEVAAPSMVDLLERAANPPKSAEELFAEISTTPATTFSSTRAAEAAAPLAESGGLAARIGAPAPATPIAEKVATGESLSRVGRDVRVADQAAADKGAVSPSGNVALEPDGGQSRLKAERQVAQDARVAKAGETVPPGGFVGEKAHVAYDETGGYGSGDRTGKYAVHGGTPEQRARDPRIPVATYDTLATANDAARKIEAGGSPTRISKRAAEADDVQVRPSGAKTKRSPISPNPEPVSNIGPQVGDSVIVNGKRGVIDGVRQGGKKIDVKFAGEDIATSVRMRDVENITRGNAKMDAQLATGRSPDLTPAQVAEAKAPIPDSVSGAPPKEPPKPPAPAATPEPDDRLFAQANDPQTTIEGADIGKAIADLNEPLGKQRGTRGHKITAEAATKLLQEGKVSIDTLIGLEPGAIVNAERLTAYDRLVKQAIEGVDSLVTADASAETLGDAVIEASRARRKIRGLGEEPGRATEIQKTLETINPDKALARTQEGQIAEMLGLLDDAEAATELGSALKDALRGATEEERTRGLRNITLALSEALDEQAARNELDQIARARVPRTPKSAPRAAFREIVRGNLLSGMATATNVIGNTAKAFTLPIKFAGAAGIESGRAGVGAALGKDVTRAVHWSSIAPATASMVQAIPIGVKRGWDIAVHGKSIANRFADFEKEVTPELLGRLTEKIGIGEKAGQRIGGANLWGSRLAMGTDQIYKEMYRSFYETFVAHEAAAAKGLKGDAYDALVAKKMAAPSARTEVRALQFADRETWNSAPGAVAEWLLKGRDVPVFGDGMFMLMPFISTHTNILNEGFNWTPIGFGRLAKEWRSLDPVARATRTSQAALGTTSLMVLGGTIMGTDNITGSGPLNAEKNIEWRKDHQQYSIRIGGNWVDYSFLGGWAIPVMMMADYADAAKYDGHVPDEREIGPTVAHFAKSIWNATSYWDQLDAFLSAIHDGDTASWSKVLANLGREVTPQSAALTTVRNVTEGAAPKIDTQADLPEQTLARWRSFFPGGDQPGVYDRPRSGVRSILPIRTQEATDVADPNREPMFTLGGGAPAQAAPPAAPRTTPGGGRYIPPGRR